MKKKQQQLYYSTPSNPILASGHANASASGPGLNQNNIVGQVGTLSSGASAGLNGQQVQQVKIGKKSQQVSQQQPRNLNGAIVVESATAGHSVQRQLLSNHSVGAGTTSSGGGAIKKVNNFMIDASAYSTNPGPQSSQNINQQVTSSKSGGGSKSMAKGSSQQPNHHKTHSSGAVTTKHASTKNSSIAASQSGSGWKFVERRLSAKVLGDQTAGPSGTSKKAQGAPKGSIQYENLMLQQLLKQQQKMDGQSAGGVSNAFKKNLSVISIDHHPTQAATLAGQAPSIAPHMMLNISYNMNNNIDANSAAQFVFHQQPAGTAALAAAAGAPDPVTTSLQHLAVHHPLTNQQQQQIRTIIGLATGTGGDQGIMSGAPGANSTVATDILNNPHHHTTTNSHLVDPQAAAHAAAYKTQVDVKKKSVAIANPYHTNASSSLLGEGMMTYENSIVQAVKHGEMKYREQSFDQIKRKRRSVNSGAHLRSKQLSSNSGRRGTIAQSNKSTSQQPTGNANGNPHSRSNSSKRNGNPHGGGNKVSNYVPSAGGHHGQHNFRGESSRGLLNSGNQPTSSHSNNSAHQHHYHHQQNKKNAQKRSIEQAKLKVKGTFSQPPELQNQRAMSGHQSASTAPIQPGVSTGITNIALPASGATSFPTLSLISENDKYLFSKLDEALQRDLKDKASSQRVAICSKVWSEIIRRQEPVIFNLLTQIKQNYEHHIKHQNKLLSQHQKERDPLEEELTKEKEERKLADEKVESLTAEVQQLQTTVQQKDEALNLMKKQILQYRREIIELSSQKKHSSHHHNNSKSDGRRVPRLDLSKLHRDSEDGDGHGGEEGDSNCPSIHQDMPLDGDVVANVDGKNVTYKQYLQFLENEEKFDPANVHQANNPNQLPPADQLQEESQESIMRQEELKQRKNKIIQLLNGDISEEDNGEMGDEDDEDQQEEDEEYEEEDGIDVDFHHQLQQQQQPQLTSEDFDEYHIVTSNTQQQRHKQQLVTSNDEDGDEEHDLKQNQKKNHRPQIIYDNEEQDEDIVKKAAQKAFKLQQQQLQQQQIQMIPKGQKVPQYIGGNSQGNAAYIMDECLVVEDIDEFMDNQKHFMLEDDNNEDLEEQLKNYYEDDMVEEDEQAFYHKQPQQVATKHIGGKKQSAIVNNPSVEQHDNQQNQLHQRSKSFS